MPLLRSARPPTVRGLAAYGVASISGHTQVRRYSPSIIAATRAGPLPRSREPKRRFRVDARSDRCGAGQANLASRRKRGLQLLALTQDPVPQGSKLLLTFVHTQSSRWDFRQCEAEPFSTDRHRAWMCVRRSWLDRTRWSATARNHRCSSYCSPAVDHETRSLEPPHKSRMLTHPIHVVLGGNTRHSDEIRKLDGDGRERR